MTPPEFTVLVVAKAPVDGLAKTRLSPPLTPKGAADVAAAALLDTMRLVVRATNGDRGRVVVSMTGELAASARYSDVTAALSGCHVVEQRGATFGERLSHAHHEAAERSAGAPVVQIGMDTPHANPKHLREAAHHVSSQPRTAAIGDATDGGWWLLALAESSVAPAIAEVPMSRHDTGSLTRLALIAAGLALVDVPPLTDVDTWDDALAVASSHPDLLFSSSVRLNAQADYQGAHQ